MQFQLFIFCKPRCLQRNFHGRLLSIRVFSADGHYETIECFCLGTIGLIVAPRTLDVLQNMLVLRTSNFQGATIRPIVPRHKHSIVFHVHH